MINKENLEQYIEYFISYYGRSHEYYTERLSRYYSGKKTSFNIYAFFMSSYWLLFRKLFKHFFLAILFIFIFSFSIQIFFHIGLIDFSVYTGIGKLTFILFPTIIGIFSNRWYLKKSIKIVESTINSKNDPELVKITLKKKGGTSIIWPILFLLITIFLGVLGSNIK